MTQEERIEALERRMTQVVACLPRKHRDALQAPPSPSFEALASCCARLAGVSLHSSSPLLFTGGTPRGRTDALKLTAGTWVAVAGEGDAVVRCGRTRSTVMHHAKTLRDLSTAYPATWGAWRLEALRSCSPP